jgi:putative membrane protein
MELRARARDHVPALAAVLTVVSLALVFGAALGAVPRSLLPRASDAVFAAIPHVNAVLSTVAIVTIVLGVRAIRRGNWRRHRAFMLASLVLFVGFLALYLYKVSVQGPAPFPGPDTVYRLVYLPTLAVHVILAIVCLPLLYYVVLLAATHSVPELTGTRHATLGRVAASLWLVSFVLGNVVYALLYVVY